MYNLFKEGYNPVKNVSKVSEFDYIKRTYLSSLLSVESYYHSRVYAVKNQHILVRLLTTLGTPLEYDLEKYLRVTDTRSPYISKHFGFSSPLSKGEIHNGIFYGVGVSEYLIYNDDYFDPYAAHADWRNICAVKVLQHPKSDLGCLLPNGRSMSYGDGLAMISININLLAVQYRAFCLDQYAKTAITNSLLGVTHFVHMYVIPNMIYSHIDIALLNRLMALYYGAPIAKPLLRHAFTIHDYTNKVDASLAKVLKNIKNRAMTYTDMMLHIPAFSVDSISDALMMPDIAETIQVHWLVVLTRLQTIKFLIDVGGDECIRQNLGLIRDLQLVLKRLDGNNIWRDVLPKTQQYDVTEMIKDIRKI